MRQAAMSAITELAEARVQRLAEYQLDHPRAVWQGACQDAPAHFNEDGASGWNGCSALTVAERFGVRLLELTVGMRSEVAVSIGATELGAAVKAAQQGLQTRQIEEAFLDPVSNLIMSNS